MGMSVKALTIFLSGPSEGGRILPSFISGIDHVAITVADLDRATEFYRNVLGASSVGDYAPDGPVAVRQLSIGGARLNIHRAGNGIWLVAEKPTPGSVDICFRWSQPIETAIAHLKEHGVAVIEGPVAREASDGASGQSVYFRDVDGNLLEFLTTV